MKENKDDIREAEEIKESEEKTVKEYSMSKKMIKDIVRIISFTVIVYWAVNHLSLVSRGIATAMSVISPFIVGLCLAFIVNVLLVSLEKLWCKIFEKCKWNGAKKLKRPICLVLSFLLVFGALFAVIFMILPEIAQTFESLITLIPQFLSKVEGLWNSLAEFLDEYNIVMPEFDIDINNVVSTLQKILDNYGEAFLHKTVDVTSSIISVIVDFVIALAFAIYLLAQKERFGIQTKKVLFALIHKKKAEKVVEFASFTARTFSKFVTGQLTEAVIIGLLCFIGMLIFRMPYAGVISVLVGATALIPVFGALIGTIVGAFLILITSPVKALWFVIFILILQQLEGNLIYPRVVGKSVGLPGIWVITAVTVGGNAFGLVGMLFSVPVCSVLYTAFREYISKRIKEKKISFDA
ncbi:MAG: AI-2E family transporter [Ruminococcaceae bacterium]|nr:AI-2E family transporter [Oscillospiraceae bacterium]